MTARSFSEQDVHLALDGELPAEEQSEFEAWLETSPEMKAMRTRFAEDRAKLQAALGGIVDEPLPPRLMTALTANAAAAPGGGSLWKFAAIAATLLAVGGLGGYLASTFNRTTLQVAAAQPIVDGAINAHLIYANEKRHVVEVAADQAEHLNTWLSNRVGVKLVAPDLKAQGFELVGGRLLPAGERTAAQYMYQDLTGNRVSLYVTRDDSAATAGYRLAEERGARSLYWQDDGYGCAVTGTLPKDQLTAIANIAYDQLEKSAVHP